MSASADARLRWDSARLDDASLKQAYDAFVAVGPAPSMQQLSIAAILIAEGLLTGAELEAALRDAGVWLRKLGIISPST